MRIVLMLAAAVLAAGCTTAVEGTPSAAPPAPLPPRPREVRLDGVDPCSLLTPEQRTILGLGSEDIRSDSYVELFRGRVPACSMTGFRPDAVTLSIATVTSVGIERWQEPDLAVMIKPVLVNGYPALIAMPTRFDDYCSVEIDVAPGQIVDVQFGDGGSRPPVPQAELCSRARESAESIMTSLAQR